MTVWVYLRDGSTVVVEAATAKVVRRVVRERAAADVTERVLVCRGADGQVVREFPAARVIGFRASSGAGNAEHAEDGEPASEGAGTTTADGRASASSPITIG